MGRQQMQDEGKGATGKELLHWQLCEDEMEWQLGQQPASADSALVVSQQRRRQGRRRWYAVLGVLLVAIAGGAGWHQAQLGVAKIEAELQSVVDAEAWLPIQQQAPQFNTGDDWRAQYARESQQLQNLAEPGELVTKMEVVDLGQEWAVVEVVLQTIDATESYRQTRFYCRTDEGWLRSEPDASLWKPSHHLETEHFIFDFHQRDAQAVAAVAAEVDTLYTTMLTNFGVPVALAEPKLHIIVGVNQTARHDSRSPKHE